MLCVWQMSPHCVSLVFCVFLRTSEGAPRTCLLLFLFCERRLYLCVCCDNSEFKRTLRCSSTVGMLVPILATPASTRPNFMLILGDDLGFDLAAAYDHPLSVTPHLDRLARSSLVSTGHHAGGATCAPSRAALMSGRSTLAFPNARNNGVGDLPTVTDILNQHGYETAHFGKWHLEKGAVNGSYSLQVVGGLDQRQQRHPYSQRREKRLSTSLTTRALKEEERDAAPGRGVAPTPLCARVAASPWAGQSSTVEARAAAAARPPRRSGERSRGQRGAAAVREQAALLCPPTSDEARRRHAEAVRLAEAEDAAHIKEARAAAKAARAARSAGNMSREKVHYTLDPSGGSTRAGASFCSRLAGRSSRSSGAAPVPDDLLHRDGGPLRVVCSETCNISPPPVLTPVLTPQAAKLEAGAARRGRGRRRRGVAASARRVAPLLRQRLAPRAARAGESVVEGLPAAL